MPASIRVRSVRLIVRLGLSLVVIAAALPGSLPRPDPARALDTVAPTLIAPVEASVEAASDHILLWLDELIDPGSIPDPTDFVVIKGGVAQEMTDVDLGYQGMVGSPILEGLADQGTAFLVLRWEPPTPDPEPSQSPPQPSDAQPSDPQPSDPQPSDPQASEEPPQASEPPTEPPAPVTEPPGSSLQVSYTPTTESVPLRDAAGNEMAAFPLTDAFFFSDQIVLPFVDEGAGPDHLLLLVLGPIQPFLPAAADFSVEIRGRGFFTPESITRQHPDLGYAILDLALPTDVLFGEDVFVTYPAPPPAEPSGAPASPSEPQPTASEPPPTPGPELRYASGDPVGPLVDLQAYVSVAVTPSRDTPIGASVSVSPADSTTGATLVDLTFQNVTVAGTTTLATSETTDGADIPGALELGDPPTYFDLSTTATFNSGQVVCAFYGGVEVCGYVEVCIHYGLIDFTDEASLRLIHEEAAGVWVNVTTSLDTAADIICGLVTSFSWFTVAQAVSTYTFSGFFTPVDNRPTRNGARPGTAIPVHFSLGGDFGLDVFAAGYPKVRTIDCSTGGVLDSIEETVTAGSSSLRYNRGANRYTYVWKTAKSWAGICRELVLVFNDTTRTAATFTFR